MFCTMNILKTALHPESPFHSKLLRVASGKDVEEWMEKMWWGLPWSETGTASPSLLSFAVASYTKHGTRCQ